MSYYTGRYAVSHGATWNRVPLSVGEVALGEMLCGAGLTLAPTGVYFYPMASRARSIDETPTRSG